MKRIAFLDLARGIAMIYVILYHIMFDIRYIFELPVPELLRPGNAVFEAAHVIFLWVLFSVSGICLTLSRDPVRRGAVLYLAGFGITLVTELFMPSELIVFGVLSCFGACMVIMGLCRRAIAKLPLWTAAVTFLLWFILRHFPQYIDLVFTRIQPELSGYGYLYPIGIIPEGFRSADFFPVIPYIFMFLTGCILSPLVTGKKLPALFYYTTNKVTAPIEFIGRHSLIIYLAHQPLIFGALMLILKG